ncbi:hypothetical protein DSL92_03665 [Billgrantia gudaonensis]|uniref:NAD(P) transhydrogenase alpha subunit C-terminal domain-containing protein n=1 Tax=Billgrantia gudaonensis TaxID=376427 RepID=A0A432JKU3_9GAMM|nr:hypothetical protein DSL92_03665 [Halomonas gudaonensis]
MSGSNAISGITLVGGARWPPVPARSGLWVRLGTAAVTLATISIGPSGFLVTNRMLRCSAGGLEP